MMRIMAVQARILPTVGRRPGRWEPEAGAAAAVAVVVEVVAVALVVLMVILLSPDPSRRPA